MDLKIKEEFKSLIPSLTDEEYKGLEQSIIQDGCRDKIITWKGYIIDGHNRYEICKKHNIEFKPFEKDNFETEADVKLWMIENQFNRRNLPIETRMKLAYRFKEIEAEKAKERQLAGVKIEIVSDVRDNLTQPVGQGKDFNTKIRERGTLGEIAKRAGVSHTTAEQYDAIQRKGSEEQKAQVDSAQSSIKKVYTQIQKAERLSKNEVTGADVEPDKILAAKDIEKLFLKHFADKYIKNDKIRYVLLCEDISNDGQNNYFQISNCTKEEVQSLHSQYVNG